MNLPDRRILASLALLGLSLSACGRDAAPPAANASAIQGAPISGRPATDTATARAGIRDTAFVSARHGFLALPWDGLSGYDYDTDSATELHAANRPIGMIPRAIAKLDGRTVMLKGFMLAVTMDDDRVKEFMLMKNQLLCCYGVTPKMNEWVYVTCRANADYVKDVPVTVYGRLRVGEQFDGGALNSIYRLDADDVELPEGADASSFAAIRKLQRALTNRP